MTIGDTQIGSQNTNNLGGSVVLCNTEKGLEVLKALQQKGSFPIMTSDELQEEKNRFLPRSKPIERQAIEKMGSYRRIEKKYLRPKKGLRSLAVRVLKRIKRAKI